MANIGNENYRWVLQRDHLFGWFYEETNISVDGIKSLPSQKIKY